ncbi:MAG: alanine racemase [Pseudomonadota bacterium]|jgi:alanine racemase
MDALRPARARIDLTALRHNFGVLKSAADGAKVFPAIKADAYGHGMLACAQALRDLADGFVVATLGEAEVLRKAGITQRIMVLQGFASLTEARLAARLMLEPVIHQAWQVDILEHGHTGLPLRVWLKIDTGMHRMGIEPEQAGVLHERLMASGRVRGAPGFMTHFACADEPDPVLTRRQIEVFRRATAGLEGERSLSNSAGLLGGFGAGGDIVRPGIALYGGNPFVYGQAAEHGLRPVMTLTTRLLAVREHPAGAAIGYGATWTCPEAMPVGIAAIGYGDGYPRRTPPGTPVLVNGQRAAIIGRVSMDLITLDLRGVEARPGDEVELWGRALPVDEVAQAIGTISYDLTCAAGAHVAREYLNPAPTLTAPAGG